MDSLKRMQQDVISQLHDDRGQLQWQLQELKHQLENADQLRKQSVRDVTKVSQVSMKTLINKINVDLITGHRITSSNYFFNALKCMIAEIFYFFNFKKTFILKRLKNVNFECIFF